MGRWYREYVYPSAEGLTVLSKEITHQREQAAALSRSQALLRHAETLTDIGGWELDATADTLRWTDGTYRIHGLDPTEDRVPPLEDALAFYHPDDQEQIDQAVRACLEAGKSYELELRLITAAERTKWVQTHGDPIRSDGEITGARGAIQDITDRKSREEELRELSQFQEAVIDNTDVWITVLDEDANVRLWNAAAEDTNGYAEEEVIGHGDVWEWLYPDDDYREEVMQLATQILRGETESNEFETCIQRNDGEERTIRWTGHRLTDHGGDFTGSVSTGIVIAD